MKAKFLLTLLTYGLLGLASTTATATPATDPVSKTLPESDLMSLSQTIAQIVGFDRDTDNLVELAIERALIAQQLTDRPHEMRTAGAPVFTPNPQPLIRGRFPAPAPASIGQAKLQQPPRPQPPQPPATDR